MKPIDPQLVQEKLTELAGTSLYIHLETTNGAYASHKNQSFFSAGAFIRNVQLNFLQGKITGKGPYRIGLETELGWLYAEGLTEWETDEMNRVLLAGHDADGKLAIALELSEKPFPK
ncbi:YojF family protein [Salipaludibacillus sp. CUR1]|uniref:YojF family protein n=1 Tax=Salipaludibacillus sp. CUR1 TaxID=2820003 RepID=UPI001E5884A1|nr:YojF family protein [Salipaludibacillus sp. CUR1]MCE7791362.1 YojF family protein [Salipaludibacillus sp. CUR1]